MARKPFGQLKRFVYEGSSAKPRLLICAPMSGHFATLLRGTVERMIPTHDVYITDWKDARDVPLTGGGFDLETYIDYLIEWLEFIGPDAGGRGAHMLAVCQPSVPAYAAAAVMSAKDHPLRPRTLTMMGGPIDTREAPTAVNNHATQRPHDWFVQNVVVKILMCQGLAHKIETDAGIKLLKKFKMWQFYLKYMQSIHRLLCTDLH